MVQRLLSEVGSDPDQLPRLQHLLARMWERSGGGRLTMADYDDVGGKRLSSSIWNPYLQRDLSAVPLLVRKQILRRLIPDGSEPLVYVNHSELSCVDLFRQACRMDLEGVVVKYKFGAYGEGWFKRSNPAYSQKRNRHELFSRPAAGSRLR